jgi:DNA-directed RNA polymerase subunit K/omega
MSELESQSGATASDGGPVERVKASPIHSRFLYVDISALRAKQLRRGAKMRLSPASEEAPKVVKAERVAMEEVRAGLVEWALPDFKVVLDSR